MSTGPWGASTSDVSSTVYNLQDGGSHSGYERVNQPPRQLALAGVTPDGLTLVENWAPVRGAGAGQTDSPVDLTKPDAGRDVAPRRHGDEPRDAGRDRVRSPWRGTYAATLSPRLARAATA